MLPINILIFYIKELLENAPKFTLLINPKICKYVIKILSIVTISISSSKSKINSNLALNKILLFSLLSLFSFSSNSDRY